ncbi:MAG: Asp23/Gls24 family envelope stress response protein [Clostridia bacterium]|nr:Asp23/Gls24 family envelope stress response protein [Clostridia bacterium]
MRVIALVGPSGTGKSHRALVVAHDYGAEVLIDDGLLIKDHNILAGISAKKQATAIGAIKAALFTDQEHAEQVKQELARIAPNCLLVLGTSREMVDRIAARLELPKPDLYLSIEDVATQREIRQAQRIRQHFGKHVIPAPTVAVKPRLSGVLTDPLHVQFPKKHQVGRNSRFWVSQSVVRPTFNYYGKFYIANTAIQEIIKGVAQDFPEVNKVQHILIENVTQGTVISMDLTVCYGKPLPPLLRALQNRVKEVLEHMTALHICQVNIFVMKLLVQETTPKK